MHLGPSQFDHKRCLVYSRPSLSTRHVGAVGDRRLFVGKLLLHGIGGRAKRARGVRSIHPNGYVVNSVDNDKNASVCIAGGVQTYHSGLLHK